MNLIQELTMLKESAGKIFGVLIAKDRGEDLDDHEIKLFSTEEKREAFLKNFAEENGFDDMDTAYEDDDFSRLVFEFEQDIE